MDYKLVKYLIVFEREKKYRMFLTLNVINYEDFLFIIY